MTATQPASAPDTDDPLAGRAVTVNILKGGVGKSALSMNIADRIGEMGFDVLYMDLDPNGHVSYGLGFDEVYNDDDHDLRNVLLDGGDREPGEFIYQTEWGFDFVPSSHLFEDLETGLKNARSSSQRLKVKFLNPLFEQGRYDFCIMDGGGERSKIADNSFFASKQCIIPLEPGKECRSGFEKTYNRIVKPLREYQEFDILAITPNKLQLRIDQQNKERELLEMLNTSQLWKDKIPNYARITEEEWEAIDNGNMVKLPKPGIRKDGDFASAYEEGMPVGHFNPDSDSLQYLDELAEIVVNGGIQR